MKRRVEVLTKELDEEKDKPPSLLFFIPMDQGLGSTLAAEKEAKLGGEMKLLSVKLDKLS